MEQSLFLNKYQPLYFSDFEINNEIIDILTALMKINNLNLLFIGDIGSGKTTFLNAVIKEYYRSYLLNDYQDNILYINSLKEQGINYYRNEVKTFCQTCSTIKGKKKIIVLDDIDVINEQSQQVFRNCIDKYSHNVHFISSCCNSQKVIESLQSRLTIIKINPLQKEQLFRIMQKIIQHENICIHPDAQEFVLSISNNSAKILINYMEKFKILNRPVDLLLATNVCTNISFHLFEQYTQYMLEGQLSNAVKLLYTIYDGGYSVMDILDGYFLFVKTSNQLTENQKYEIVPIICKYIAVFHNIHEDEIELALLSNNLFKVFSMTEYKTNAH
jgi:DNA polymerase III delta prime subunit